MVFLKPWMINMILAQGAAARSARVDGKENKKETLQQIKRKKS